MCAENEPKSMAVGFSHSNFKSRQAEIVLALTQTLATTVQKTSHPKNKDNYQKT